MNLNHRGARQCSGINQAKVDMPVNEAGHERARKLRHTSPLHSRAPERYRPQLTVELF